MVKRKWLLIGIASGMILQYFFNVGWDRSLLSTVEGFLYRMGSSFSLAALVGFFYLHIPENNRSMRTGTIIGTIIGLLAGAFVFFSVHGSLLPAVSINAVEIIRISVCGTLSGLAMVISELKYNPNRKSYIA